ncbi:hypothetical protein, partial [Psychrobacter sp. TB20-MNA-CIBAN-0197]|uniref:hypothetical protein n=1 Tax=Psychrobacter sp. TB20-MNA-CIBAN-0197 TaxID=3140453 RepID=UPI003328E0D9
MAEHATMQAQSTAAPVQASTISFGSLPRNNAVPEAVAPPVSEPLPKVMPAAAGRRRRQQAAEQAREAQQPLNADGSRPVEG